MLLRYMKKKMKDEMCSADRIEVVDVVAAAVVPVDVSLGLSKKEYPG